MLASVLRISSTMVAITVSFLFKACMHVLSQVLEDEARQYRGLPSDKLVELSTVTSKRAVKAAMRAAARAAKQARDTEIDERAKHQRALDLELALAEPADCWGGRGQRRQKRKSSGTAAIAQMSKKGPASSSQKRRASTTTRHVDTDETDETEEGMCDDCAAAVMVDGQEEWVVDRISASKQVEVLNQWGEPDWVMKYQVHWVGGDVTWETYDMICDCAALDEFERMRAEGKGE